MEVCASGNRGRSVDGSEWECNEEKREVAQMGRANRKTGEYGTVKGRIDDEVLVRREEKIMKL